MIGTFDLQTAIGPTLADQNLQSRATLDLESGTFDAGLFPAQIEGDVTTGAAFQSKASLVVQGSVIGSERWPCRLQTEGDIIILGEAKHARIEARAIRIGQNVQQCQITARKGIEIGANIEDTQLIVGKYEVELQQINRQVQKCSEAQLDRAHIERQLRVEEKRLYKLFETTRIQIEGSISQIIQYKRKRVTINLKPLYQIMQDREIENIDKALLEFFSKAVIGNITKANKAFIQNKPNRRTIFLNAIRHLYDLFSQTRQFDSQQDHIDTLMQELHNHQNNLNNQIEGVYVKGRVKPNVELSMVMPKAQQTEEIQPNITSQLAHFKFKLAPDTSQMCVTYSDMETPETTATTDQQSLSNIVFDVFDGKPQQRAITKKDTPTTVYA